MSRKKYVKYTYIFFIFMCYALLLTKPDNKL